jgi:hypothetical protein
LRYNLPAPARLPDGMSLYTIEYSQTIALRRIDIGPQTEHL